MPVLDQIESIREVDKSGMAQILKDFPQRVAAAFAQPLPDFHFNAEAMQSVAIVGLGGSAIGGDLAATGLADRSTKPVEVVRGATLPAWARKGTLVVAVSYSGNTGEALTAYAEARQRECPIVVVASGGRLKEYALRDRVPFVQVSEYPQPRLAVGDLTAAVMKIAAWTNMIAWDDAGQAIVSALKELHPHVIPSVPTEENPAKLLAYKLLDRLPIIAGGGVLAPVARRWKTQVNENAKSTCVTEMIPELFHNTIEGLKNPPRFVDDSVWVILETAHDPAVSPAQLEKFASLLQAQGIRAERVAAPEKDVIAAQWRLVYMGDWVSYYLACLNGVDPMPVPVIQGFKADQPLNNQTPRNTT